MAIAEGSILASKYEIEARLGEGGMGVVYRARHLELGRTFAIKVLRSALVSDAVLLARFRREAELAGRLRHANVISVVDLGVTPEGEHYLVMEYAPGITLGKLLEAGPLPQARVIDIARQLCDGLQHAHDAGLLHRDFKPDNVIVETSARGHDIARIADFGVSILLDHARDVERERLTTKGVVVGTPRYMAPEHARGLGVDHRADLFALGLIFYEMLAGAPPYEGTGAELARANVHLPTPPMGVRAPGVRVEPVLEALVRNLLAKDPDDRLPTASAVRELLDLFVRDPRTAAALFGLRPQALPSAAMPSLEQAVASGRNRSANHSAAPYPPVLTPPPPVPPPSSPPPREQRASETTLSTAPTTRRALVIAIAIGAVVFFGGVWLATRGPEHPSVARLPAASPVEPVASATPAPSPAPPPSPVPAIAEEPPQRAPIEIASPPNKKPAPPRTEPERTPVASPAPRPTTRAKLPARPGRQLTPTEVAMLYKDVGRALSELQKVDPVKADDLWTRYRWIRLSDALTSPQKRAQIVPILDALQDQAQP